MPGILFGRLRGLQHLGTQILDIEAGLDNLLRSIFLLQFFTRVPHSLKRPISINFPVILALV